MGTLRKLLQKPPGVEKGDQGKESCGDAGGEAGVGVRGQEKRWKNRIMSHRMGDVQRRFARNGKPRLRKSFSSPKR